MCGINGFNWLGKIKVKEMNHELVHRGPDAEGVFCDKHVSLGHRRLAVIDLSKNGAQPMSYEHKKRKAVIVFNGEIYNFDEIRGELEEKGYSFRSRSDTEVILASYFEWGYDCVNKFNGMWAFCIYDLNNKTLFLSRDRVGKKPLHYYFDGKKFIFSSEIKGILKHDIGRKISRQAVDLYFSLGFIPAPYTIYESIKKLGAGENLVFDLEDCTAKKEAYWSVPNYSPEHNTSILSGEIKRIFEDAVKIRLISDVPLGAFLSGGLDSSAIVGEMTKTIKKENLNTFSVGFEGEYDETKYIDITKNYYGTKSHHRYFYEKDFQAELADVFYYYDEPFCDISMFPTLFLSKFAREELVVSLSGDGGDEIFGGYPRYKIARQLEILRKFPRWLRALALKLVRNKRLAEGLRLSLLNKEDFYTEARPEIYKPDFVKDILRKKLALFLQKSGGNLVEAVRMMDIAFYTLPDNFLAKVDRASMAHALEIRCPFLDYRLVEYSSKIPSELKTSAFDGKVLMKKIFGGMLPKEILRRKKQGFTPPVSEWIMKPQYAEEIERALRELFEKGLISGEWFNFYSKIIKVKENDEVYNNYKTRLFVFYRWYKYWATR